MEIISVLMDKMEIAEVSMAAKEVVSADLTLINQEIDALNGEVIAGQANEKLESSQSSKAAIKAMITAKGVAISDDLKFADYSLKIAQIGDKYVRPSFWPQLPAIAVDANGQPTEQVYYGLVAVFPHGINSFYVFLTDNVTIDCGDGHVEDVNANSGFYHTFNFADAPGEICERGYKMCIMSIRPRTVWDNLRYINTQSYTRADDRATTLEIKAAFLNNLIYVNTLYLRMMPLLESIELVGSGNFTAYGIGNNCPALKKVTVDVTNMATPGNFFRQDNKQPLELQPFFDISKATGSCDAMFLAVNLKFPDITIKAPTAQFSFTYNFYQMNVRSVIFDDMSKCTDLTASFSDCLQLTYLRMPGVKVSFYIGQCNLDVTALVALFGDLADLTGFAAQTITVTGNPGVTLLTPAQRQIATDKNWTIVG